MALASQGISHDLLFSYDAQNVETVSAQLATKLVYTGAQLAALTNYCATKSLSLSIQVASMGVV